MTEIIEQTKNETGKLYPELIINTASIQISTQIIALCQGPTNSVGTGNRLEQ